MDEATLLDAVEYSMRNNRHILDALWMEHTSTSGHPRKNLDDVLPCAICIGIAGAVEQNDKLLMHFLQMRLER